MAIPSNDELKIVRYGHPVLRQKSEKVGRITSEVQDLVQHMVEVMRAAHGLGLAANQVGVPRRVAVVEVEGELTPLINPQIVDSSEGVTLRNDTNLIWDIQDLSPGTNGWITVQATVDPATVPGGIKIEASIEALETADFYPLNNHDSVNVDIFCLLHLPLILQ